MLPAVERLPEVMSLIRKEQYFVVHAQRQCGKTTAFQALADEINAKGDMVALYCSVEAVQMFTAPEKGLPELASQIRSDLDLYPELYGETAKNEMFEFLRNSADSSIVKDSLK